MAAAADYYDRVNPDLLQRIPVTARAVLEVGCGAGALGAAFKAIRPEVVYVGLEQVEAAAKVASGRLDHVLRADAEDPQLALPPLPPLDCLIYGDVLEHLRDPWATLRRHAALLADEGCCWPAFPTCSTGRCWQTFSTAAGPWPIRAFSIAPICAGSPATACASWWLAVAFSCRNWRRASFNPSGPRLSWPS